MPGRPRSFDRDTALAVARDAFWRDGYRATSVSSLTGALGINPPSLYAAFGDKDRLFNEAAADYVTTLRTGLDAALATPTAREGVAAVLRAAARAHGDPATPPGCLVYAEPRMHAERSRIRATIAERIARGRDEGDVPADAEPERLAAFVDAVTAGMSARARDGASRSELEGIAEQAMLGWPLE